jgi:signal transduction histidine kinase
MNQRRRWWEWLFPTAEEEAQLEDLVIPRSFQTGTKVVALVVAFVSIAGDLTYDNGNDWVNVGLMVATVLPWALALARIPLPRQLFTTMVLLPTASLAVAHIVIDDTVRWIPIDVESYSEQFAMFLVLLMLVDFIIDTDRRATIVAFAGSYLTVVLRFVASSNSFDLAIWSLGVTLMLLAGIGLRVCTLAIIDARDLRATKVAANERRRIARDVHDVVAHTLAVTMLHVTAARMAVLRSARADALEALEEAERSGRASLSDVRRMVRLLRSDNEPTPALDAAQPDLTDIAQLVDAYRAAGLDVPMTHTGSTERVSPAIGLTVYRVAQEALANAARHGDGTATLDLKITDHQVHLNISNVATDTPTSPRGSGITGMQERVAASGGQIDVGPRNGHWVVHARLPLDAATSGAGTGAEAEVGR